MQSINKHQSCASPSSLKSNPTDRITLENKFLHLNQYPHCILEEAFQIGELQNILKCASDMLTVMAQTWEDTKTNHQKPHSVACYLTSS